MEEFSLWVVSALSAVLLGVLKWAGPVLRDKIPNVFWPIALVVFAKGGTSVCQAVDVGCSGNPLSWGPVETQALAAGMVAIILRELVKSLRNGIPVFDRLIQTAVSKLMSNPGGTMKSLLIGALMAGVLAMGSVAHAQVEPVSTWGYGKGTCPSRALAGLAFSSGLEDPAGALTFSFTQPCLVATHRGNVYLEGAILGIGTAGAAGNDAENPDGQKPTFGTVICLFAGSCLEGAYIVSNQVDNHFTAKGVVDLMATGRRILEVGGWAVKQLPGSSAPAPAAYIPAFDGLNGATYTEGWADALSRP